MKGKNTMNTQNTTAEIASNALAILAGALEAGNSAALTAYLNVMARFHKYSWTNCLLIAMQRPAATIPTMTDAFLASPVKSKVSSLLKPTG